MEKRGNKPGVALVGLGTYSSEELGPALRETKHCYLAGIVSGDKGKVEKWKKEYDISGKNIYGYENFDSIKDNDEIDIVYVVLPNSMHAEYVIRAAKAGKHVICEKPMAVTVDECDEMIRACSDAGVMFSIGYRLHFDPYNRAIAKIARDKKYGQVKKINAAHGLRDAAGWRLDKQLAGGGPLMDVGIYCVNAGRYITGQEPLTVQAREGTKRNREKFKSIEESLTWVMEYADGTIAECSCSYSEYQNHLHVDAEQGWFELAPAFSYDGLKGRTSTGKLDLPEINQQAAQMDDFARAIVDKRPTPVPGEMGRQDVKILRAIYRSMETGQKVKF
ncbi:MAG TPA: Gfo/Idh/MocA family oxidoreductase [Chitinophagaceae bacterium]|nr:Gfo/Idh/MocA family oxidoreductase [Chitinophagaceae bacterium]